MDYQTVFTILIGAFFIEAVALTLAWRLNKNEDGTRDWAVGAVVMAVGSAIAVWSRALTSADPVLGFTTRAGLLQSLGTAIIATGWIFIWYGFRRFLGRPVPKPGVTGAFFSAYLALLLLALPLDLPAGWVIAWFSTVVTVISGLILVEFGLRRQRMTVAATLIAVSFAVNVVTWGARTLLTFFDLHRPVDTPLDALVLYESTIASIAVTVGMILMTTERLHNHLRQQASLDVLTGIFNRRAFFQASTPLLASAQRDTGCMALAILDLDHFKRVNDNFGHAAGDDVLRHFAHLARQTLREKDVLARLGGEEFSVLLPGSDHAQAGQAMQRLRTALEAAHIAFRDQQIRVTVSIGISIRRGSAIDLTRMLEEADHALYQAKQQGRNRVVIYGTTDAPSPA